MKVVVGFIGMVVLTVAGAYALIVLFSGMAGIQATESDTLPETPPSPSDLVRQGAVLLVHGEVTAVHAPEWTTPDGERPNTPWEISSVPDEHWIQTPITVELQDEPLVFRPEVADAAGLDASAGELTVAVRGGEIGDDAYVIDDGQDRDFEQGDDVLLVLTTAGSVVEEPELMSTEHGPGWDLVRRYDVESGRTATLAWGDETHERPVDEVIEEFREAASE